MSNDEQFKAYLYHPVVNQSHRYRRQIINITKKTTCREVLTNYISDYNTARLIETCFGFEREIQPNDYLIDIITRNQTIKEFKIVVRHIYDNPKRRRMVMRSPFTTNNQSSDEIHSNKQQINMNDFHQNNSLTNYSVPELEKLTFIQQQQIEQNQKLLVSREQRLQQLKKENLRLQHLKQHIQQQDLKQLRLQILENQINQEKNSCSTFENEFDILKRVYVNKELQLSTVLNKLEELTKQLDQLRKFQMTINTEQSLNKTHLEKLKQELMIRNKLNEQQSQKIIYQRDLFSSKQDELNQINHRISELQQRLHRERNSQPMTVSSTSFQTALENVQNTLNNINISEIEKRMVQLSISFNSIHTNQHDSNSPKKINNNSSLNVPTKVAFASKSEIAATYMTRSTVSPSPGPMNISSKDKKQEPTTMNNPLPTKTEDQLLPPNLRLNDDILSVHFNNVASTIKKRHSFSDPGDTLIKYLSSNNEQESQLIHVRDDSGMNLDMKSNNVAYENLSDLQISIKNDNFHEEDEQQQEQSMIEQLTSDTESEGSSITDDVSSTISFSTTVITPNSNLKSLLKTATTPKNTSRRVAFDPLALLLDAAVVGDLDLLIKAATQVDNPSEPNDEGLTALHNAVCASNFECMKFLIEFGCDINYADNDGWTPLHCAASCNNTLMVKCLIEHGACIYATTSQDNETAAEKCEEDEENYTECLEYLLNIQNSLGQINNGLVYALYDYEPNSSINDELDFKDGDRLIILRRGDDNERQWWWARHELTGKEGYVPRNYLGVYPRVQRASSTSTSC